YLQTLEEPNIENFFKTISQTAEIASTGGGIGINITKINNISNMEVCDSLMFFNSITTKIKQQNKRNASIAVYLDIWHKDIQKFISMKSHLHVNQQDQTYDKLFYGIMIPDLFMERLKNKEYWSLFNPDDCPDLFTTYGDEFNKAYIKYESLNKQVSKIKCIDLLNIINIKRVETGVPYIIFRDTTNRLSNENNIGIIQCSNLCTEIVQVAKNNQPRVCNLGSLGLNSFVKINKNNEKYFDFNEFVENIEIIVYAINNMIDQSKYPIENTFALKTRALGIGVRGLADLFINLRIPFESSQVTFLNKKIFEYLYYYSLYFSCKLSKIHGTYELYNDSPISKGILHIDHFPNIKLTLKWDELRKS